ncbi:MAG: PDDEXK nuclease domain-containing protein [Burkholderiales bacterium]|nr:PDDEXK nuclease domain-containing protein [Burkholderiales bacterium]
MSSQKQIIITDTQQEIAESSKNLITDIIKLIDKAQHHVAREYNHAQVLLCWLIGKRIDQEILKYQRATYGENIMEHISQELTLKYGKGYGVVNLSRMLKFSRLFSDQQIVSTLSKELSWSHFVLVCSIDEQLKRDFYAEMSRIHKWSVRGLKSQIDSMLFERTAISKKPDIVIEQNIKLLKEQDILTPAMIFKDPYFINFINGRDSYSEADFENLIISNITDFLQELGSNFCYVARQKRMSTGKKDRYLDLLFFERRMSRLIAIDLKIGAFDPAYKGQMEWYLNWLDKNERLPHEGKPLGIILCAGKDEDDIEYLQMDNTGIHAAQYITELPQDILENKFRQAIINARENYEKQLIEKSGA